MKNFIIKLFGLPTNQDFKNIENQLFTLDAQYERSIEDGQRTREELSRLREDMKNLYSEVSSDVGRFQSDIRKIKPVLKIEDEEATKFIKDILSKHDKYLNTQQEFLEASKRDLRRLESSAMQSIDKSQDAAVKINNVLSALGLDEKTPNEQIMIGLRKIFNQEIDVEK